MSVFLSRVRQFCHRKWTWTVAFDCVFVYFFPHSLFCYYLFLCLSEFALLVCVFWLCEGIRLETRV